MSTLRIALCAGETSGDQLGAGLIEALRQRFPHAQFAGIGGPKMQATGLDAWHQADELAVMGLAEVLRHLPRLLKLRRSFRERVLAWQPDVFIGIDAPDFNLGVEAWLKPRGVRTVHYVSPSVWAWREERAAKIGASADRVLCLFPMEPPIYEKHGVDAVFVGHPLADEIAMQPNRAAARTRLHMPQDAPLLAILPGSRVSEIERMLPVFLQAASRLRGEIPDLQGMIPVANDACQHAIERILETQGAHLTLKLFRGQAQDVMIAGNAVLLASGTAALEAMLCKRPMVIGHRISSLTYAIVKGFGMLKSKHVSLPNVLAGEALVPELLQGDCTPENLAAALQPAVNNKLLSSVLTPRFEAMHLQLRQDASQRAADAVAELLSRA